MPYVHTWEPEDDDDSTFWRSIPGPEPEEPFACDDPAAWSLNPAYTWVYDRLALALRQQIPAAPLGVPPPPEAFPVIVKPVVNLYGMAQGVRLCSRLEDIPDDPGYFWQPQAQGEHRSIDLLLRTKMPSPEGVLSLEDCIEWMAVVKGHLHTLPPGDIPRREPPGVFEAWELDTSTPSVGSLPPAVVHGLIPLIVQGYTGPLNVELIGDTVIECHLRLSLQFLELYDPHWILQAYDAVLSGGDVNPPTSNGSSSSRIRPGWSLVAWAPRSSSSRPTLQALEQARALYGVLGVHLMPAPGSLANPAGLRRFAVVNTRARGAGERALRILRESAT